MQMIKS